MLLFTQRFQEIEKAEIFRKCWVVGHGKIDIDSLFVVLQDDNFLVKSNLFATESEFPDINALITKDEICTIAYKSYQKIDNNMEIIANLTKTLGVESVLYSYNELYVLFEQKFQSRPAILNGKSLQYFINCLVCKSLQLTGLKIFNITEKDDKLFEGVIIQNNLKIIQEIYPHLSYFQERIAIKEFEKQYKGKKLQKFFKKKLSSWYKLLSSILKNKFRKLIQINPKSIMNS